MKSYFAILSDIKIAHTVFALPFAVMSAFIAANGWPGFYALGLIALAMVFARSAAMAFNRLVDERFDRQNPRTENRALPAGKANRAQYIVFIVGASIGFIITCAFINPLALKLSPVALLVVFFYSYTKRFTAYSHFFLGVALSLAPVGAWVAIKEEVSLISVLLGLAVVFWLAGLDTIYSCQDVEFDRSKSLNSLPERYGIGRALQLAALFHVIMILLLVVVGLVGNLSWLWGLGVFFTAGLLLYEHSLVDKDDLSRVNVAFFNINGYISVGLMYFAIFDTLTFPVAG